ncbi:decaprenylphospho-beta-D-ribofuranose 2-oxidase [Kitasatospora sp. MAP12-15]|uniref:FAD-binding oxidoreductase n=1 Tax=unclassified Kitasatospora TaxID=2633591 RepID=UPI002473AC10|nr:FAD-binding oxidoreductase [Kitasatospora sp. MAP12-44]MDH6112587.1 decaprenylphospho-beta-D-ribofuranose 2-oxidase [Kitasatospora sp. MAP12-44]
MTPVVRATSPDRLLQGWGRTTASVSRVVGPLEPGALRELIAGRPDRGLLARGAGRSYGDAAQNAGGLVLAPATASRIELDTAAATVRVAGSTTFAELLTLIVPHGLLLPVLPGTRHLTVGGAVAADVHGKNQRADGTIFRWLDSIELLGGDGELRTLRANVEADGPAFRATVGGMGLTGVILAATLRLIRIRSSMMRVTVRRAPDLDSLMAELESAASRYAVAWIDTTATGRSLGRGIVDLGDHLPAPHPLAEPDGLRYGPTSAPLAPRLPLGLFNPLTARAFNELWYRRAPRERHAVQGFPEFFHRLDAVAQWNRSLGPRGFLQYQFAVPLRARHLVAEVLEALQRVGAAPFLGTLKRFGPARGGPLSFPLPGWSLAVDMPLGGPRLDELLHQLDRRVANAGGRVYLAKDARLSRTAFDAMYGPLEDWRAARALLDPADTMRSDLGRRLGLCR